MLPICSIEFLFFSVIQIAFVTSILYSKDHDEFVILNHEKIKEKIHLRFFDEKGRSIEAKAKINSIPTENFLPKRLTFLVSRIEATCHDKIDCTILLENDVNVIVIAQNIGDFYLQKENYFCKSGRNSQVYFFTPCFIPYSSDKILSKDDNDYVHVVYLKDWQNTPEGYRVRLTKTDGTTLEIEHDGYGKKVLDVKGTSASVREISIEPRGKSKRVFWGAKILVFIEGEGAIEYQLEENQSIDGLIRFFPTDYAVITLKIDRDSTGLATYEPGRILSEACSSRMGSLLFALHGQKGEYFELLVSLEDFCKKKDSKIDIEFFSIFKISFVEVSCDDSEGMCNKLLQDNFHIMVIWEIFNYNMVPIDRYFCKREKLTSGKYIYVHCNEKLSDSAKKQKTKDEYVHLVYLFKANGYLHQGDSIKVLMEDGVEHAVIVEETKTKIYEFLGSTSMIKHIKLPFDATDDNLIGIQVLTEGSDLEWYSLDLNDLTGENVSKFYPVHKPV